MNTAFQKADQLALRVVLRLRTSSRFTEPFPLPSNAGSEKTRLQRTSQLSTTFQPSETYRPSVDSCT